MDKRVVFAVAGSGKTAMLLDKIDLSAQTLIITYANENIFNLHDRIVAKFGHFPDKVSLYSYFTFLHSFCYRPFLQSQIKSNGLRWDSPTKFSNSRKSHEIQRYVAKDKRLYHCRLARLLEEKNVHPDLRIRLEKYFDVLLIDEVQDFGGHDFNFLKHLVACDINMTFVGDFFQHTYDTSRDGSTNKNLHEDYPKYLGRFTDMGLQLDTQALSKSYRCAPKVCDFVRSNLGISIHSHHSSGHDIEMIETSGRASEILRCPQTVKLFYQEHFKHGCFSRNWGATKGQDCYRKVCVVLNATTFKALEQNKLEGLAAPTRNKLYVACTRAKESLALVSEKLLKEVQIA